MSTGVYLLLGQEFLVEEALDRVRREIGADLFAEETFDAAVSVPELAIALGTSSLLGGARLVVVRDADALKKDHIEMLARYIESPGPDVVLVLTAAGRTKLDAAVKKAGTVVVLEPPRGRRLVGWLRQRARDAGLRMDDRGGWALIDSVGTELRDLDAALHQLATAHGGGTVIGAREVHRAFPRLADERIYALTDSIGDRRIAPAMTALRRLLDQGEEPLVVFGSVVAHVRRMLRARRYAEHGTGAVADALGLPNWRAERLQKQARTYREDELVEALSVLARTDVEMKSGDVPPEAALERAVVEIVEGRLERV